MKKKTLVVLGLLLSFSIAACGGNSNAANIENNSVELESTEQAPTDEMKTSEIMGNSDEIEQESDETESAEAEEVIYNIGETAQLKDWEITITDIQIVDSISADYGAFNPNEEGNKFVQVFATVENKGKQADRFLPSFGYGDDVSSKILYGDGYEFTATQLLGYGNDLHDSTVNPLSSQSGEIAFEIPETVASDTEELLISFSSGNDAVSIKLR